MRFLQFILFSLCGFLASGQSANSVYLCLGNDDIVLADLDNCSSSLITTLPESLFDISQGDTDDTLYGIKDERLYRINVSNGSFVLLGNLTVLGFNGNFRVTSLVKERDGFLLGANQSSNGELFRIDVNAMTATNLGATGFESAGDLTFLNGVLYLSADNNELVQVNINTPSQSSLVGSMSLNGGQNIFGVVSIITANPCASNPTVDLIATGGRSTGVVNPSNGNTTTTCINLVNSSIFGAAEVTSDVICTIDIEILGDGLQNPEFCGTANPNLTTTVDPNSPIGTYTYEWREQGSLTVLSTNEDYSPTVTTTTTFECTVTDTGRAAPDNIAVDTITVTINDEPVYNSLGNVIVHSFYDLPSIDGTNIPANARYYTQPNGNGTPINIGDQVRESDFSSNPGTLYVFGTDANSCELTGQLTIEFVTTQVTVEPVPTNSSLNICEGDSITLRADTVPGPAYGTYTYNWDDGLGSVLPDTREITVTPSQDTTYSVTVNDSGVINGTAMGFDQIQVTVNLRPSLGVITNTTRTNSYEFPVINGNNLTGNQAFYTGPNGTGQSYQPGDIIDLNDFSSFPITIYIYDNNNGCDDQTQFELTIEPINLTLQLDPDSTTICQGGTVTITAIPDPVNPVDQYTYEWTVNGSPDPQTGDVATFTLQQSTSTITCTVTDLGIAGAPQSFTRNIQIDVLPSIQISNPGDQSVNNSFTFPAITGPNVTANALYSTQSGGAGQPFQSGDVVTRADFATLPIQIFIYDTNGTCDDEESFILDIIEPQPTLTVTSSATEICEGEEITLSATADPATPTGDYSYEWTVVGDTTVIGTERNLTIIPEASTSYQCTITDSGLTAPNDQASDSISINVNASPSLDVVENIVIQDQFVFPDIRGTNLSGNAAYFTNTGGQGTSYVPGDVLAFNEDATYPLTIFIYDESAGCFDEESFQLTILEPQPELFYIPQFVTPNEDNYHDTWNVEILNSEVSIEFIYIYDRYGKLVTQIVPGGIGWDGTLNNNPLPSSSYWYQFVYTFRGTEIEEKGYFALKR
ncbi:T9SS type B sorting domain-containing protein [Nonlabens spongiae]|uniref:T9SS type B sorting domain-containing protein n=1 Tax=Nonlabens spongiae TaxID=331648 RepID=UPI000A268480|nr:T9SS type B sorting domain-containing protein [Nonlabens spongiae]